jgi:hypothetical protein
MTFVEVVVGLAVVGVLAAVVVPEVSGYLANRRAVNTAIIFTSLHYSLNNNNTPLGGTGFVNTAREAGKDPAGRYPATLTQLVKPITNTDADCSGATYSGNKVNGWLLGGPFTGLLVTSAIGVTTPMGVIRDGVFVGTGNTVGLIELRMDSVTTQDAENLDFQIDRAFDADAGQLRYTLSAAGAGRPDLHLVKYLLPTWVGC